LYQDKMGGHHSQFTEEQLKDYQVKQQKFSSLSLFFAFPIVNVFVTCIRGRK